jgi:hypothetical protein
MDKYGNVINPRGKYFFPISRNLRFYTAWSESGSRRETTAATALAIIFH